MNEIEEKIIQELTNIVMPEGQNCPYCKYYIVKDRKEHIQGHLGFLANKAIRVSVEMARKEFLDKIIKLLENKEGCPYCSIPLKQSHFCIRCNDRVSVGSSYDGLIEEIKQSLGNKND